MHPPTDDWYTGPIEQIIPAPPGWLLATLVEQPGELPCARLHPVMCWARVANLTGDKNTILPVIEVEGNGQPYAGRCALIAPGHDLRARLAEGLDLSDAGLRLFDADRYTIDPGALRPGYLYTQGWQIERYPRVVGPG